MLCYIIFMTGSWTADDDDDDSLMKQRCWRHGDDRWCSTSGPGDDRWWELDKWLLNFLIQGFLTFINAYDVRFTTKIQNVFMFTKIAALVIIIMGGVVWLCQGMLRGYFILWEKGLFSSKIYYLLANYGWWKDTTVVINMVCVCVWEEKRHQSALLDTCVSNKIYGGEKQRQ